VVNNNMSEKFFGSIPGKLTHEIKTKEDLEKEWQQELIQDGQKFGGVKFKFVEPRLKIKAERLPAELDWDLFSPEINEEDKKKLSFLFSSLIDYLDAPIITDNFINHDDRRDWEKKYLKFFKPATQKYYNNNRLGINFNSRFYKFYSVLNENQEQGKVLEENKFNQLQSFTEIIPKELKNVDFYRELNKHINPAVLPQGTT